MTTDLAALVKSLDLPAKVRLLTGATAFTLADDPSIGLHEMRFSDGPTGVRGLKFIGGRVVTLFPNATLLASTWDDATAYEVGRLLAEEAMAQRIHVVLGPTINLHRSPLGGRLFEAYSEDPLLTGKLAAAYVRGLQDSGVAACLKHLVANESETERNFMNSVVDEKTLHELYLLPFEIAADAWSIMAAYNDVNGVAATEQQYVNNEIVKGAWGYDGLIMSDWFATKTAGPAANGGLDLVMPGPGGPWGDALVAAVESGEVEESTIDDHVIRLLRLAERVGALGEARAWPSDLPKPDSPVRRQQLTELAARGMTVLKNDHDLLPLDRSAAVALIGRHALETIDMGGGSAGVNPPYQVSVAEGLVEQLGAGQVTVVDGVSVRTRPVPARGGFLTAPSTGAPGIDVILLDAAGNELERRFCAQAKTMIGMDDDFTGTVATARLVADVHADGPAELGVLGIGRWTVTGGEEFELVAAGTGIGEEVLTPPVRTFTPDAAPGRFEATVTVDGMGLYGLIGHAATRETVDVIDDAVRAVAGADVAVVVVGLTEEQETESVDKSTLELPGAQDQLVEAVAGAARRTVVVVNAATPVLMPWLDRVDAVLWAGLPGQEGGHAVAAALLGDIEPAGRLVTTFPSADGASPAWSVTPVGGQVAYGEKTFVGYRGHAAARAPEPAFWLGHGLGYGEWEYSDVRLVTGDAPSITVTVRNVGRRVSREVVQVYLRPVERDEPVRLVGWTSVTVEPGKSARVTVHTDRRLWRRWDVESHSWAARLADGGEFLVARGLGDIRATVS
ncbi:glycoside hydrolase family 3 C-terminal domain-containing protein [Actinoplanes bogorensis]|uniref:Glycoside hydrolase family 3 C-terminal domain-containing protein n=1 Tax=Paractinoplanes bogorensis TaxID=1610840 RepID=A0ABS5Z0Y5_9ACTN|nr:glycoside hydrolase family 3 C-terminal domain-containing protein [Actinoplanes bogorensis]MBU2669342.1 glycoside hydrolase family 3 C-terminal domain-containing protein [Actinoplanes bogorensis]